MRLKELRKTRQMSQAALAKELGVAQNTVSNWENGNRLIDTQMASKIASYFGVSVDYLLCREDNKNRPDQVGEAVGDVFVFPVLVSVRAGFGNEAVEMYGDQVEAIPLSALGNLKPEECRVLLVRGNSMYPRICNGDKVLIHLQDSVGSGSVAVVIYNGDEATLKRVKYVPGEDWVELIPYNPEYQIKRIEGPDLAQCRVIGRVVKLIRDF